jgi:hypothetical protein
MKGAAGQLVHLAPAARRSTAVTAGISVVAARALLGWSGEMAAHLDAATAERVCAELLRTTAGRTAIVTSHRPALFPGLPRLRLPAAGSRAPVHRRAHSAAVLSAADDGGRAGP